MRKPVIFIFSLMLLSFSACNNRGGSGAGSGIEADSSVQRQTSGQIAYINLDTLMKHYDMYKELTAEFEAKAKKAESDITGRGRSLEKSVQDAQSKIERGLVTRAEAAQLQEDLQKREQSFYQYRDNLQVELAEENQVMTNKIFFSLEEFVRDFNSDYRYGVIMTTSGGTPIINADPALDITPLVIKGLNEKYAQDKKQTK